MRSLFEHIRLSREGVDAMMVSPLNSSVGVMTVYPFNRKNVEALIDDTVMCGYYMKRGNMPLPGMVYVDNENRPRAM